MFIIISCDPSMSKKPNFVFILIDDLGWTDLGYTGSKYYETPNIDNLAGQGMIFTNAYSNAANCAPTRASLLTGQYAPRHGVFTVASSARGKAETRRLIPVDNHLEISLNKITIAESLKKAGYVSAAIGKWHVGHNPKEQGFDYAIDRGELQVKGHFRENGDYLTDLLTDEAIGFMERNDPIKTNKPFFLYLSHHAVHTPIQAKDEHINHFENKPEDKCHDHVTYAAMIKSVDESVGRIQGKLIEMNLSENTLLIFFSDNGGHGTYTCQRPLRGGKGMYYEGGIRVPMFACWPGTISSGSINSTPIIGTDFYPTYLDLAGADHVEDYPLDGLSIAPALFDETLIDRGAIYWHFPAYLEAYKGLTEDSRDEIFRTRPVSVIRKGDWKLLMFHEEWVLDGGQEKIEENNSIELYNLSTDIGEQNNLSSVNVDKRDELLNDLLSWQKTIDAAMPNEANDQFQPLIPK